MRMVFTKNKIIMKKLSFFYEPLIKNFVDLC